MASVRVPHFRCLNACVRPAKACTPWRSNSTSSVSKNGQWAESRSAGCIELTDDSIGRDGRAQRRGNGRANERWQEQPKSFPRIPDSRPQRHPSFSGNKERRHPANGGWAWRAARGPSFAYTIDADSLDVAHWRRCVVWCERQREHHVERPPQPARVGAPPWGEPGGGTSAMGRGADLESGMDGQRGSGARLLIPRPCCTKESPQPARPRAAPILSLPRPAFCLLLSSHNSLCVLDCHHH